MMQGRPTPRLGVLKVVYKHGMSLITDFKDEKKDENEDSCTYC